MQPQQNTDELVLGPIGNRIIFENEQVRVWELAVDPGKNKGVHRHDLPYVIIPMTDGDVEIRSVTGQSYRVQDKAGQAIWRDAGEVHDLINHGSAVYRNVLVEIKQQSE